MIDENFNLKIKIRRKEMKYLTYFLSKIITQK